MIQKNEVKKVADVAGRTQRWSSQPEGQDLNESRTLRRWMTTGSRTSGKKAWKGQSRQ